MLNRINNRMHKKNRVISQINVTPFVDVMLVLLIVFMITAPLLTVGVSVDLPKTKASQLNSKGDPIIISIKKNGELYIQEREIDTLKLFEITNNYKLYDNQYYLPFESQVKYFIKDARLAGWLKKDMKTLINPNNQKSADDVIRGVITVNYLNYKINTNLPDRIFKKKKPD